MEKRNGFTLIELLAVIVILAIIALIAVPVIMNVINKANKSAFKDTAYGIISAGELYFAERQLDLSGMSSDEVFDLSQTKELQIKGEKPEGKVAVNTEGKTALAITNGRYCITKGYNDNDVTVTEDVENCNLPVKVLEIGDEVYYDPVANAICDKEIDYTEANSLTGAKTGCMRWYVYKMEGNNVGLILDHNTTGKIEWLSYEKYKELDPTETTKMNSHDPVILMDQLKADTEDQDWKVKADIVDALDLVKLIPYFQELDDISKWEEQISEYWDLYGAAFEDALANVPQSDYNTVDAYLDAGLDYAESKYSNLMMPRGLYYDLMYEYNLANLTGTAPSTYGYWTKTANSINSDYAWFVYNNGYLDSNDVFIGDYYGLRPVISLSKSLISQQ